MSETPGRTPDGTTDRTAESGARGRFDIVPTAGRAVRALLGGAWDGVRLRCPSCGKGRLFRKGIAIHTHCPQCGVAFERPGEGDFVGAMFTAYAITAGVFCSSLIVLRRFVQLDLAASLWLSVPVALLFVLLFYRNMKGIWVALLIALTKWVR